VLHIHDPLAWWPGHHQSITLNRILTTAEYDLEAALALAARGTGPHHSDPRAALDAFAIPIRATALGRWPFSPSVDYLAFSHPHRRWLKELTNPLTFEAARLRILGFSRWSQHPADRGTFLSHPPAVVE
jgi:hypothetical protein